MQSPRNILNKIDLNPKKTKIKNEIVGYIEDVCPVCKRVKKLVHFRVTNSIFGLRCKDCYEKL